MISSGNEPSTCMPNSQLFDGNYNSTNHREIPSSTEFFPQFSLLTFNKMCLISKYLCWYRNESVLLGQAEFSVIFFSFPYFLSSVPHVLVLVWWIVCIRSVMQFRFYFALDRRFGQRLVTLTLPKICNSNNKF